jgi:hypothetical protein
MTRGDVEGLTERDRDRPPSRLGMQARRRDFLTDLTSRTIAAAAALLWCGEDTHGVLAHVAATTPFPNGVVADL